MTTSNINTTYSKHNMDIVVKLNDFHIPYHDNKAIAVALKFVEFLKPKILVIDEVIDFYSISKYDKDPRRKLDLQKDIDKSVEMLALIRKAAGKAKIIMVESNHDKRLSKYLTTSASELSQLRCLQFEELLHLKDFNIEYRKDYLFRKILFKHGNVVRSESSYTAKAEFMKEGMSGASGHTHRLGMHFKTLRGGKYVWLESGCLCKRDNVEYIEGTANWQQGLSMFLFKRNTNHYHPVVIPIIDYRIIWGKRIFRTS